MKKVLLFFLLSLFFLFPNETKAYSVNEDLITKKSCQFNRLCGYLYADYFDTSQDKYNSSKRNGWYYVSGGSRPVFYPFIISPNIMFRLSTFDTSQVIDNLTNPNMAYSFSSGEKAEVIWTFSSYLSDNVTTLFEDLEIYYDQINFYYYDENNKIHKYNFLELNDYISYVNFGITSEVISNTKYFYLILDFEVKKDIKGFEFLFAPFVNSDKPLENTYKIYTNKQGQFIYSYPIFENGTYLFSNGTYQRLKVGTVDEFTNLKTEIAKPVIPNLPEYNPYEPDDSVLEELKNCSEEDFLARIVCHLENIVLVIKNTFIRIGQAISNLVQNCIDFFNGWNLQEVAGWNISDFELEEHDQIGELLTFPISLTQKILKGLTENQCQNFNIGSLLGTSIVLPCFTLEQYLGTELTNLIDFLFCVYMVYNIAMLIIHSIDTFTNVDDLFDELYVPQHAYTGYKAKHGRSD